MIGFFNIRTGEKRAVDTEPMLAAFWNSSDQGPNSHEGQDFGWRVAPETLKRMKDIKSDRALMDHIKVEFQLVDPPKDIDILRWVSLEEARKQAETEQTGEGDYTRQYEEEVRALDQPAAPKREAAPKPERKAESNDTDSASASDNGKIEASKNKEGK